MSEYIEREAAIQATAIWNGDELTEEWIKYTLEKLPAADVVERKIGQWERFDDGIKYWWECSECHHDSFLFRADLTNFCPNCGAAMRGGEP